jgi:hypothetical protein
LTALARLRHYWAVALSGAISMTSKFSVGALVGAWMLVASYCPANALTFHFSFNNGPSNDAAQGLVQGTISGLQDNLALQHATSVQVQAMRPGLVWVSISVARRTTPSPFPEEFLHLTPFSQVSAPLMRPLR